MSDESIRQNNPFDRKGKKKEEPEPEVFQPTDPEIVNKAIDDLLALSLTEKRSLLIIGFRDTFQKFRARMTSADMEAALDAFLLEELQGKLVAAKTIED